MLRFLLRHRFFPIMLLQAAIIATSLTFAYLLRFDLTVPSTESVVFRLGLLIAIPVKLAAFSLGRMYRGWSRFVGLRDVFGVLLACLLGSIFFCAAAFLLIGPRFPRSIYVIDLLVCFLITTAVRSSARIHHELMCGALGSNGGKRVLVYGAGAAGVSLVHEIQTNIGLGYRVAGFIDDDPQKWNTSVIGVPVLGPGRAAPLICQKLQRKQSRVEEIVIAMPSVRGVRMQEALANCRAAGVPCKTVPGVGELLNGRVITSQLREVSVNDLLGREPVELDESLIRKSIEGRTVMVTGAGGSIGSEICRQVARFLPCQLVLLEQAESDLFRIHNQLIERFPYLKVHACIGDIRNYVRVEEVVCAHHVDSIFHAAAYKHVPLMESHALEAAENNILGTHNVVTAAIRNGVSEFLLISSDKAVNPTNVMGATKRVAELMVSSYSRRETGGHTKCVSVRFGNVLGSNGSVVPVFQQQIERGGPVTVTHPDMRRYFMTIPEAVQLVLQASTMGKGSEIFVLDMGEAVRIVDLARNMIRLSGREPDKDIEIRFTGLRPGEKLFEELATESENILSTYHPKIKIFSSRVVTQRSVESWLDTLEDHLERRDAVAVIDHMQRLVPEYQPETVAGKAPAALAMTASQAG